MAIQGLRHTGNFANGERPEHWRAGLLYLYPNSAEAAKAPLTALTTLMKSSKVDDPVFHWWEKSLDDRRFQLTGSITGAATTLSIDPTYKTARSLKEGDVLLVEQTGEVMHVVQNPVVDNQIVVARGIANGGAGTAINTGTAGINPFVLVIGSAFEEGSMAPSGVNFDPNDRSNYTQIFRSTLEMTRTAEKTRLRTGDAVKEAKRECLEYIGVDMERAFWFGKKHSTTKNGKPLRFTAGVRDQINSLAPNNIKTFGGPIDMDELNLAIEGLFRTGSSEKMVFAGNMALLTINEIVRKNSSWQIQNGLKEYGMAVTRLTTPFGELVFKAHPLFTQSSGGINGGTAYHGFSGSMAILDMANIEYKYIDDLHFQSDLQANGLDGQKSGYLAECGLELHHAGTHFWWNNVVAAKVDD